MAGGATTKILSLDGGGAKGFYTLGALREIEAMLGGQPLCEQFRLIFGTSTGSIIAALLALGEKVDDIHKLYRTHVPRVTEQRSAAAKSAALAALAKEVFKEQKFDAVKTGIGIVATRWVSETPMVFSVGVGVYPKPKVPFYSKSWWINRLKSVRLLQKTLEINTQSMDQLRKILFGHIKTVRISDTFQQPEMATDLFESDLQKLDVLHQRGAQSFANVEKTLREYLL